jgi:hypothetical protein
MLITNQVTDDIQQSVNRKDYDFGIQSMHVSKDGKKALLLGIYEDPDFPAVFIFSAKTGKARRVNSESAFIDVPLGKAFWAANGRDFYINCYESDTIYRVELDSKSYKIRQFEEIEKNDEYIEAKLKEVLDLIRDDNNYREPVVALNFENKHHELVVKLLDGFHHGIQARIGFLKLFWSNYEPEVSRLRARDALGQFQGHYFTIESLKQELDINLDTGEIKAALDKLREMADIPGDK